MKQPPCFAIQALMPPDACPQGIYPLGHCTCPLPVHLLCLAKESLYTLLVYCRLLGKRTDVQHLRIIWQDRLEHCRSCLQCTSAVHIFLSWRWEAYGRA